MAATHQNARLVRALINEPIHPLGPDVLLHLREYCGDFSTVTTIDEPEPLQDVIDTVGEVLNAVEQTLERFELSTQLDLSQVGDPVSSELALRRRIRDASRYLCDAIDVLECILPQNDELKALARRGYGLLEEMAFSLNMSVQEVQARSVA